VTRFNNDILVLANPEIAQLPGWVIALIAAGGLAAALSTAAGLLLAISSAVSHDLIKSTLNPGISEKGELLAARISMAFAIVLATYLGLNPPGFAAQVVALAFGLAAATLFPVLMMGIFSKRMNSRAPSRACSWGSSRPASTSSPTSAGSSSPAPTCCRTRRQLAVRHLAAVLRDGRCGPELRGRLSCRA
jgi:Na+(H+)/acetate symporter ActP